MCCHPLDWHEFPTFPGVAPLTMVTVLPETVARVVSLLSKVTGNPELDSALTVNGALAGVLSGIGWKAIS